MMKGSVANLGVELGSNWIHDYSNGEVERLAKSVNLTSVPTDYNDRAHYSRGNNINSSARMDQFRKAWNKSIKQAYENYETTVLDAIEEYAEWKAENKLDCSLLQFVMDYAFGRGANKVSAWEVEPKDADYRDPNVSSRTPEDTAS